MKDARTIIVAGAGIGGLVVALALVREGYRVVVLEAARQLTESGAGIQLSPNATHVLSALGLRERLRPHAVALQAIRIMSGRSGGEMTQIPLGSAAEERYGAPYWVIHRGDLQQVLLEAVEGCSNITLRLGFGVRDHATSAHGVTIVGKTASGVLVQEQGLALVGADGLWSAVRLSLGHKESPRFARRTAWRAMVPANAVDAAWRQPMTHLWLGPDAHLVHYPVKGGSAVNLVAIIEDDNELRGWNSAGARAALLARFSRWSPPARAVLTAAESWRTWSLFNLPSLQPWGRGPVTLLGDAAHAMLPFLAQGGAMAIEDVAVLAAQVARADDMAQAFRAYEAQRYERTRRAARAVARTGTIYHLSGPLAAARDLAMRLLGGKRLLSHYDWLYDWKDK